ncbi:MAG: hypothetical protein RLZZ303_1505 [Candidatus Hydrogenedentota bacterium]
MAGRGGRVNLSSRMLGWTMASLLLLSLAGCGQSLHDLAARGDIEAMRDAIARNPESVNSRDILDKTPLHHAVSNKRLEAMALLVESGADINAADKTGLTPLHVAAMQGRRDEAAWLLDHGADATKRDSFGDQPIHTAAVFGMGGSIQLFRQRGMAVDTPNASGETPLDIARKYRHEKLIAYLEKLAGAQG